MSAPEPARGDTQHGVLQRLPSRIWKGALGLGALAGAILAVAGVARLVCPDSPDKPAVRLVERIDTATARYRNALDDASDARDAVDPKVTRKWSVDAAGIKSAIHADFSRSVEGSWDHYVATLRSAESLLAYAVGVNDAGLEILHEPDASDFDRGLFTTRLAIAQLAAADLIEKAGGGDLEALTHAEKGEFDDAWADVMDRVDRQRRRIDDALLSER